MSEYTNLICLYGTFYSQSFVINYVNEVIASKELNLPLLINSMPNQQPGVVPFDLNNSLHRKLVTPSTPQSTCASNCPDLKAKFQGVQPDIFDNICLISHKNNIENPYFSINYGVPSQQIGMNMYDAAPVQNSINSACIPSINYSHSVPNTYCNNSYSFCPQPYPNCLESERFSCNQYSDSKLRGLQYSQYLAPIDESAENKDEDDKKSKTGKKYQRFLVCKFNNCNKVFKKTWNFMDHYKVHTGIKPHKCSVCSKSFAQKGNLVKHMKLRELLFSL